MPAPLILTCWITGASSGIGRALALLLAERGHTATVDVQYQDEQLAIDTGFIVLRWLWRYEKHSRYHNAAAQRDLRGVVSHH